MGQPTFQDKVGNSTLQVGQEALQQAVAVQNTEAVLAAAGRQLAQAPIDILHNDLVEGANDAVYTLEEVLQVSLVEEVLEVPI